MLTTSRQSTPISIKHLVLVLATILASCVEQTMVQAQDTCSTSRYQHIDSEVTSDDGRGHGPDIGSNEWKSVIEFKLGIRDNPETPPPSSEAWCQYIENLLQQDTPDNPAQDRETSSPSFDCSQTKPGSSESIVCDDHELATLDLQLDRVYSQALELTKKQHLPLLAGEQRGWIKGRDECWKSPDQKACIADEYRRRIAELQAHYQLAESTGPVNYICDKNRANEVIVTFFDTEPKTLIARRGDKASLMFIAHSASGAKYQGRNESFWESKGVAQIVWGYQAKEMLCEIR